MPSTSMASMSAEQKLEDPEVFGSQPTTALLSKPDRHAQGHHGDLVLALTPCLVWLCGVDGDLDFEARQLLQRQSSQFAHGASGLSLWPLAASLIMSELMLHTGLSTRIWRHNKLLYVLGRRLPG